MFTGIVQAVAAVTALEPTPSGARLELAVPAAWALGAGESVAVNGCCLTVVEAGRAVFDLSPETLARTSLGGLKPGAEMNVERALRAGDALGGHIMAGHVDGLATLLQRRGEGEGAQWRLRIPAGLERYVADKGSVALDGVSLTPFGVADGEFSVALIPATLKATNLRFRRPGEGLNFEADLLARYVERMLPGGGRP